MQQVPFSQQEDSTLLLLLGEGDKAAFESIYNRHADALFRFVNSRIASKEDSQEIIQEIFIWLWTKRASLHNVQSLRAYLFSAAKHSLFNYFRSAKVRKRYAEDFIRFESTHKNATEQEMNLQDIHGSLEESLSSLPERCQTAFRLSRIEHMPIRDIAQKMAISTRTVENYITQALKHLRNWRNLRME